MAVPERAERVANLLQRLALDENVVSWDEHHAGHVSNWWRAIDLAGVGEPSHLLILEDDAEPCRDFLPAVQRIVEYYPARVISFFSPAVSPAGRPANISLKPHQGLGDVAVVYPRQWLVELRQDFLAREAELQTMHWQAGYGADEVRLKLRPHATFWTTSPSLVQHGNGPSTLGHRLARTRSPSFIGWAQSALALDWSTL